jgi:hypothetical protein
MALRGADAWRVASVRHAVAAWRVLAEEGLALQQKGRRATAAHAGALSTRVLRAWHEVAAQAAAALAEVVRGARGSEGWRARARALMRWLAYVQASAAARATLLLCLTLARGRWTACALRTWAKYAASHERMPNLLVACIARMRRLLLGRAVRRWAERTAARLSAGMLAASCARRLRHSQASAATRAWGAWLRAREERLQLVRLNIGRSASRAIARAVATWRGNAADRSRRSWAVERARTFLRAGVLPRLWEGWRDVVATELRPAVLTACGVWRARLLTRAFGGLGCYHRRRQERRHRNALAAANDRRRLAAPRLACWRSALARRQAVGGLVGRLVARLRRARLERVWATWGGQATAGVALATAAEGAAAAIRRRVLQRALDVLAADVAARGRVAALLGRRRGRRALGAWLEYAAVWGIVRRAAKALSRLQVQSAWLAWGEEADTGRAVQARMLSRARRAAPTLLWHEAARALCCLARAAERRTAARALVRHVRAPRIAAAIGVWRGSAQDRAARCAASTIVANRRRAGCFEHWADQAGEARLASATAMARAHSLRRICRAALRSLAYAVRLTLMERAAAHFAQAAAVARAFRWLAGQSVRLERRALALAHWAGRLAAAVLHEWHAAASEAARRHAAIEARAAAARTATLRRSFDAWGVRVVAAEADAERSLTAVRLWARRALHSWHGVAASRIWADRVAHDAARVGALRAGARGWRRGALTRVERADVADHAEVRLRALREAHGLRAWRVVAAARGLAVRQLVQAVGTFRRRLLKRCFGGLTALHAEARAHLAAADRALAAKCCHVLASVFARLGAFTAECRAAADRVAHGQRRAVASALAAWWSDRSRSHAGAARRSLLVEATNRLEARTSVRALGMLARHAEWRRRQSVALRALWHASAVRGWLALRRCRREAGVLRQAVACWAADSRVWAVAERASRLSFAQYAAGQWRLWRAATGRAHGLSLRVQYLVTRRWVDGARNALYALASEAKAAAAAQAEVLRARANQLALEQHRRRARRRAAHAVFGAWAGYTGRSVAVRWAAACHVRRHALLIWAARAAAATMLDRLGRVLGDRVAAALRLAVLRAWREAALQAARARVMQQRARLRLGACVVHAWQAAAAGEALAYRERAAAAAIYHLKRLSGVTFFHWRALTYSSRAAAALSAASNRSSSHSSQADSPRSPTVVAPPPSADGVRTRRGSTRATMAASQQRHLSQLRAMGPLRASLPAGVIRLFSGSTPKGSGSPSGADVALTLASHFMGEPPLAPTRTSEATEGLRKKEGVGGNSRAEERAGGMGSRLQTPLRAVAPAGSSSAFETTATATSMNTVAANAADFDEFERIVAQQRTGSARFR